MYLTIRLQPGAVALVAAAALLLGGIAAVFSAEHWPAQQVAADAAGTVYLTFDDGPSPVTAEILDVLKEEGVCGTFFVIGGSDKDCLPLMGRAHLEGHAVGVHTFTHDYSKIYSSEEAFWDEMQSCALVVQEQTGEWPTLLRFPGGSGNTVYKSKGAGGDLMKQLTETCALRGYTYNDWNVDTGDSLGSTLDAETIARRIISGCSGKDTAVVLMHDSAAASTGPEALRIAIPKLKEMGFVFKTLKELDIPVQQSLGS